MIIKKNPMIFVLIGLIDCSFDPMDPLHALYLLIIPVSLW